MPGSAAGGVCGRGSPRSATTTGRGRPSRRRTAASSSTLGCAGCSNEERDVVRTLGVPRHRAPARQRRAAPDPGGHGRRPGIRDGVRNRHLVLIHHGDEGLGRRQDPVLVGRSGPGGQPAGRDQRGRHQDVLGAQADAHQAELRAAELARVPQTGEQDRRCCGRSSRRGAEPQQPAGNPASAGGGETRRPPAAKEPAGAEARRVHPRRRRRDPHRARVAPQARRDLRRVRRRKNRPAPQDHRGMRAPRRVRHRARPEQRPRAARRRLARRRPTAGGTGTRTAPPTTSPTPRLSSGPRGGPVGGRSASTRCRTSPASGTTRTSSPPLSRRPWRGSCRMPG